MERLLLFCGVWIIIVPILFQNSYSYVFIDRSFCISKKETLQNKKSMKAEMVMKKRKQ